MTKDQALKRAGVVFFLLALGAAGIVARLVQLQVVQHPHWAALAQALQEETIEVPAQRGTIYDCRGRPLACDVPAYSIALDNYHMTKPELLVRLLEEELGMEPQEAAELVYRESYFTWLARRVDREVGERLRERARQLGIRGLLFFDTWKRAYPLGPLAPEVLGVVGVDGQGLAGLELSFDQSLSGRAKRYHLLRGLDGRVYDISLVDPGQVGEDLRLTLDADFQRVCQEELGEGLEAYSAGRGLAIIMEPCSGAVLALAQALGDEPQSPGLEFLNPWAVTQVFEPGSTFKAVISLAALDRGVVTPESTFNGDSPYVVAGIPIHNAQEQDFGFINFRQALVASVNTVLIQVAERLGIEATYRHLRNMGFGEETGIELPGEVRGLVRPLAEWTPVDLAVASFGQGVAVTGIQLATAFCAIANDGVLPQPHLVAGNAGPGRRVASPEAAATLRELLRATVASPGGTGRHTELPGFYIAGKSGTGQKASPQGGYLEDYVVGAMAAFFPWWAPEYVVLVVYDDLEFRYWDPYEQTVQFRWGGTTAGPTVKEIVADLAQAGLLLPYQPPPTTELGRSG
jgi:cell division protein FtsI/penicillin-binding protein 2